MGFRRFLPLLAVLVLQTIAIALGLILLVIPGIVAALMFGLAMPICAVEALRPIQSLDRSRALTKGHRWRIFGLSVLIFTAALVAVVAIVVVAQAHLAFLAVPLGILAFLVFVLIGLIFPTALFLQLRVIAEGGGPITLSPRLG